MSGAQFRQPSSPSTGHSNVAVTIADLVSGTNRTSQALVSANFFRHLLRSNDVFLVIFREIYCYRTQGGFIDLSFGDIVGHRVLSGDLCRVTSGGANPVPGRTTVTKLGKAAKSPAFQISGWVEE